MRIDSCGRGIAAVVMGLWLAGCAAGGRGIERYQAVEPDIFYRGAQPTEAGYAHLKRAGIRTVVDLRGGARDEAARRVRELGLGYVHVPCEAGEPSDQNVARILSIVLDARRQPVFVHCREGKDRTGTAAAAYRMLVQGWTAQRAIEELRRTQGVNALFWPQIPQYLRQLDVAGLRQRIRGLNGSVGAAAGDVGPASALPPS